GVDARGMDGDDALKAGNYGRNPDRTSGGCGLCEERRLGALTTLLPPRAKKMGKHPAVRPARVVDGGELCCACNRHWQDASWPVVRRPPDDARPARPAAPEPEKAASRKERRAANGGKKSA